jgi:hypothetical protein
MYGGEVKTGKSKTIVLKETGATYVAKAAPAPASGMVRTQIYLTPEEHRFVDSESRRKGIPMAAVIRSFIDEKMVLPADAWVNNPFLKPPPHDPNWEGHEDGSINHDHYVYGCPKKYVKKKGKWVPAPPLDE